MKNFKSLYKRIEQERKTLLCEIPSKKLAQEFIEEYISFLFPVNRGCYLSESEAEIVFHQLQLKFKELISPIQHQIKENIDIVTQKLFAKTDEIFTKLMLDAKAFIKFDPAAYSISEVIVSYPGFFCICVYRITHEMYKLNIPILPRLISEYAHGKTGIDIHPGATIGNSFFIDHGTGVVIGETAIIKNNVKIYQGVTLGALSVKKTMAKSKRHPTIEDNVIIYANATILGGDTIVGHDSIIGGNAWLTESVPAYSLVFNKSETIVKRKKK